MDLLALADDLTGALEVGAKFAAPVEISPRRSRQPRRVFDTETRRLPPDQAATRILQAAARFTAKLIYKKTDSTLRGNIGAELAALLDTYPDSALIYAPSYPKMGRVVRRGILYVQGAPAHETSFAQDRLNPVSDSDIARVLRAQTRSPIHSVCAGELRNLERGSIYVCDGESDAEIAEAARFVITRGVRLAAGPAAFAEALAGRMDLPRRAAAPWPRIRSCLVINGSRHELSLQQVSDAVERGWRVATAGAIPAPEWVILDAAAEGTAEQVAEATGNTVRDILSRVKLEALVIFGGDTAYGIVRAIGSPALRPLGELVPGVPLSRVEGRDLMLITKAGGFGPVEVLSAIRSALR